MHDNIASTDRISIMCVANSPRAVHSRAPSPASPAAAVNQAPATLQAHTRNSLGTLSVARGNEKPVLVSF